MTRRRRRWRLLERPVPAMRAAGRHQRGASLTIVLALVALLQLLALAQVETAWVALRTAGARRERLTAYVAADAGLVLCARLLQQGTLPIHPWTMPGEPAYWRAPQAFAGAAPAAVALGGSWPGASVPPQCLVESRPAAAPQRGEPAAQLYLLTVRGSGTRRDTQSYLQQIGLVPGIAENGQAASASWAWRSVAGLPD